MGFSIAEKLFPVRRPYWPRRSQAAAEVAAHKLILHDLERVATENGSVISSLFGALAGSGALPFPESFEDAIRRSARVSRPV